MSTTCFSTDRRIDNAGTVPSEFRPNRTYTANFLNQYTLISNLCDSVALCDEFVLRIRGC